MSEVASARRAPAAEPAVWPIDQPRLESANAKPCAIPSASAPSKQRHRRRPQHPDRRRGEDHQRDQLPCRVAATGTGASARRRRRARSAHGNSRPRRSETRPTIGLTPDSSAAAAEPGGADRRRADAEVVEPQRREHGDRAEHQPGHGDQPHAAGDAAVAQRGEQLARRRSALGRRRRRAAAPRPRAGRRRRRRRRTSARCPTASASAPTAGPASAPAIAARHRRADHLAAALARRGAGHPGQRAGPRGRAADALDEARRVEHDDRVGERERDAGRGHEREPEQDASRARPPARRGSRRAARRRASRPRRRRRALPAADFDRSNSSSKCGSSGVIAA